MSEWIKNSGIPLEPAAILLLRKIGAAQFTKGSVLFRAGDQVQGFAVVLSGKVGVYLTGASGREIQLYEIKPGQTCVQSTLGLLGSDDYSAEAVCESDCQLAFIPCATFMQLLTTSEGFRTHVFQAFSSRLQNMMELLEQVAFVKIETRIAAMLLKNLDRNNQAHLTHQELATKIGSAREVVSRRLDVMAKRGILSVERSVITVINPAVLQSISEGD